MPKKITHVITGLGDGGAEATLFKLCTRDPSNLHSVISLMGMGKYGELLLAAGVPTSALNFKRGTVSALGLVRLARELVSTNPDIVQTWMPHADLIGGVVARVAGFRKIFWGIRHSDYPRDGFSTKTLIVMRILGFLSKFVPEVIVSCGYVAADYHGENFGYGTNLITVIPNGVDGHNFAPQSENTFRSDHNVLPGDFLIGSVGRFHQQKDFANFLSALKDLQSQNRTVTGVLVGSGLDWSNDELVGWVTSLELEDKVILLGAQTELPKIYSALDVYIMSSAYGEGFPNAVAEAMACGTPCVVTSVGDGPRIVGDTGFVVPPRDSRSLANALEQMLALNKVGRVRLGKQARSRILEEYTIEKMLKRYADLYSGKAPRDLPVEDVGP